MVHNNRVYKGRTIVCGLTLSMGRTFPLSFIINVDGHTVNCPTLSIFGLADDPFLAHFMTEGSGVKTTRAMHII